MSQAGEFIGGGSAVLVEDLTGNSGGPVPPTGNNINTVGTGSITVVGNPGTSTLTTELTGLTNHAVLVGAGTTTITKVGPTATAGQVLQSAGAAADPAFSTATYPSTTTINQILYSSAANTVTGLTTANDGVLTTGTTGTPVITPLATNGQLIIGSGSGAPIAATLTAGSGIAITNGANSITISSSGSGGVTGPATSTNRAISTWNGTTGSALFDNPSTSIDSTGRSTNSAQPVFSAYLSAGQSNVTGDGTIYTIVCDGIYSNVGSYYNNSTGVFTAPVSGNYLFTATIWISNMNASHTQGIFFFNGSNNNRYWRGNPYIASDDGQNFAMTGSWILPLSATNTMYIQAFVTNGTKTVSVQPYYTTFSGVLLC